jgi:hypothetical protein
MPRIRLRKYNREIDIDYEDGVVTKVHGMRMGTAIALDATKCHVDENGVTVITEARLNSVSLVPYTPGDERYGVYPIQRGIEPIDAEAPLPPLPTTYEPTNPEIDRAIRAWNAAMPRFDGLLDAEIEEPDGE